MKKKIKYYVIWRGHKIGIFDNWDDCKKQVEGFPNPLYKAFDSRAEAEYALSKKADLFIKKKSQNPDKTISKSNINRESICVDAACSGNPGDMEYRAVDLRTNMEIFKKGPYREGTNNIGEFLAIVHGIGWLIRHELKLTIYTDSVTAMSWVKNKKAKTKLTKNKNNIELFDLIDRAEIFLQKTDLTPYKILKWNTKIWGEIPADFGRK